MSNDNRKNAYRDAYEAASLELAEIVSAFEQLCEQKNRIEELLTALEPDAELAEPEANVSPSVGSVHLKPFLHRAEGFSVATHCSAVWSTPRA